MTPLKLQQSTTCRPTGIAWLSLAPLFLLGLAMTVLVLNGRALYAAAALAAAFSGLLVLFPRVSFYLFMISLSFWIPQRLTATFAIHPFDLLMGVLIVGSVLEYLLRGPGQRRQLTFDLPFLALIAATVISAIFAFKPAWSIVPTVRIVIIYCAFLVAVKFAREIGVRKILKLYLLLVTLLSLQNVVTFVAYGGLIRAFGPSHLGYESLSMTGMPMALAFGLWADSRRERWVYIAAALLIGLGIVSTQARGPLLTILIAAPVLLWISWRKAGQQQTVRTRRTIKGLMVLALVVILGIAGLSTTFLSGTWERYEALAESFNEPQGTIALRITLWKMALKTFMENPLTGIGIGNFRIVHELYSEMRLAELHRFIKGFSAHNVILHYLAETGLPGALSLLALAFMGWRRSWRLMKDSLAPRDIQVAAALFIGLFVFTITLFYMRAWTWGQGGYIMALLFGLTAVYQPGENTARSEIHR